LLIGVGVVARVLAFQDVAMLLVVVAQFVVNGAMFLSFQPLPGGRPPHVPKLGSRYGGYCQCGGSAPASPSHRLRTHVF